MEIALVYADFGDIPVQEQFPYGLAATNPGVLPITDSERIVFEHAFPLPLCVYTNNSV